MKVYLASSFSLKDKIVWINRYLESKGIECVDKWWTRDLKTETELSDREWYSQNIVKSLVKRHWHSIENCDAFVLIAPRTHSKKFNGANIELGYALACGITCFSVGLIERSAMYVDVIKCEDHKELADNLEMYYDRKSMHEQ